MAHDNLKVLASRAAHVALVVAVGAGVSQVATAGPRAPVGATAAPAAPIDAPRVSSTGRGLSVTLDAPFFGERFTGTFEIVPCLPRGASPADVLVANEIELRELAMLVDSVASRWQLDSYGRFRLAVNAVDALGIQVDERARAAAPSRAIEAGRWDQDSRLLAIGALLRLMDVAAMPFTENGRVLLGVPTGDDGLNTRLTHHTFTRTRGGVETMRREFTWLPWDGTLRPGDPSSGRRGTLHRELDTDAVLDGPTGIVSFFDRTLPEFTLRRGLPDRLALHGGAGGLDVVRRPDAAAYLDLFPEFKFVRQYELAMGEMDVAWDRVDVPRGSDESVLVTSLLRTCQADFEYSPGRLRPLLEMLETGRGDCDQLALLMAVTLTKLGYSPDDLRVLSWPDHVGLALRPHGRGPTTGRFLDLDGGRFYVLDPTYYRVLNESISTSWGDLPPGCQLETAQVLRLPR